jgi:hypothetical protein
LFSGLLVEAEHTAELADRVRYGDLPAGHVRGRLTPPGAGDADADDARENTR